MKTIALPIPLIALPIRVSSILGVSHTDTPLEFRRWLEQALPEVETADI